LVGESRELGVSLPYAQLQNYESERTKNLGILPTQRLFDVWTVALFSLKAFADELDVEGATKLLLNDGSMPRNRRPRGS
jgi:hypothetical protein